MSLSAPERLLPSLAKSASDLGKTIDLVEGMTKSGFRQYRVAVRTQLDEAGVEIGRNRVMQCGGKHESASDLLPYSYLSISIAHDWGQEVPNFIGLFF